MKVMLTEPSEATLTDVIKVTILEKRYKNMFRFRKERAPIPAAIATARAKSTYWSKGIGFD
jgi:hypothetical protein